MSTALHNPPCAPPSDGPASRILANACRSWLSSGKARTWDHDLYSAFADETEGWDEERKATLWAVLVSTPSDGGER